MRRIWLFVLCVASAFAQNAVNVRVDAGAVRGPFNPIYRFFGYDEPNYTYAPNGRKLIGELAALSHAPVYIRTHFLLATGDGTPRLKWGSTNAYTEDATGKSVYDWTIIDRIFDTYLHAGAKPFVEVGFMPRALSSHPDPYRVTWVPGAPNRDYAAGWSYPPRDFRKWSDLIYAWVRHSVEKYGRAEVASWYWEVWNEPDIFYWHGTPEQYDELYDHAAAAVKRALPEARVGGPATTGPANPRAAAFLRQFLEHCERANVPLDFISFHAKGRPTVVNGRVEMGSARQAADVEKGFEIVASSPRFRKLPVILSESDPEGCAACSARVYPQNAYRNGPLYAAYTAAMMNRILGLAERERINLQGMLTWAFAFEDQPYFDGLRTLATNGIDKPVLNFFRMAGLMEGDRIEAHADGVQTLAVRGARRVTVLVSNYSDDTAPRPAADVRLEVAGVPERVLVRHYRIDETHSNAWTAWQRMGSPQRPTPEQHRALERAGQLEQIESPRWFGAPGHTLKLTFALPAEAVSLVELDW